VKGKQSEMRDKDSVKRKKGGYGYKRKKKTGKQEKK